MDQGPAQPAATPPASTPALSVVVPAHNEAASLPALCDEFEAAVRGAGVEAELIVVDDGSTDDTDRVLAVAKEKHPWLWVLRQPSNTGQTAACAAGVAAARGAALGMLDADGQNDPADLVMMLRVLHDRDADLVQGWRKDRQDPWNKRAASRVARAARRVVLGDRVRDTGCSCRVARTALAKRWPLDRPGMHRFIPALSAMLGASIVEVSVRHRPRVHGLSHYGNVSRGLRGAADLWAVRRLRRHFAAATEPHPAGLADARDDGPARHSTA